MTKPLKSERVSHRKVTVSNCPRCGSKHETALEVLVGEVLEPFDYWSSCPTVNQPFYVCEEESGDLVMENEMDERGV